ncbi:MAG: LysR substrate-binding domain-containing protein [Pseudomonadota bacterium]
MDKPSPPPTGLAAQALRRLRLRHLELLHILGGVATVRQAAEQLSLSQPAVSKMLQEVEAVCGTALFTRGRRGIEANAQGRLLIRHAGFIIQQLQAAGQQIGAMEAGASGLLRIGSFSTVSLLPQAIVLLCRKLPELLVRVVDNPPRQLVAQLIDGEIDCALTALPPDALPQPEVRMLHLERIAADRLCVVASPRHRLAQARRLEWRDVVGEPWVLSPPDALTRQMLTAACLARGLVPPQPVAECLASSTVRWLVRFDPTLLGLMRHHQAREEAATGQVAILPVGPAVALPDIALITRRDSAADPAALAALAAALRQARRLGAR